MPVSGLESPCPVCGRTSGDHTLREWSACFGEPTTDLPFEITPPDAAKLAAERVRESFDLDSDLIIADNVLVTAATLGGAAHGGIRVRIGALIHDFQIGVSGAPPQTVAKVMFLGDPLTMRKYGRLARDSANGAANAVERAA